MRRAPLILFCMASLAACETPRYRSGNFDSPDPAAKLYAIRRAGETKDTSNIKPLVEQLKSDDPAVRVFAIQALERITGQRLGYNPYADAVDRNKAVLAWEEAVKQKRFVGVDRSVP